MDPAGFSELMRRQEFHQVIGHRNGPHAGSAPAMWYGKCLMQVQVADISTDQGRIGQSNLCIHIRTIHIYLSPKFMHHLYHFLHLFFENTMRGRIGYHKCGQPVLMVLC